MSSPSTVSHPSLRTATRADNFARDKEKKPRLRHTEEQLAALNELYDENEHPSLEERAALAEHLGMEAKAVNAWFANKRSATKKKTKGPMSQIQPLDYFEDEDDNHDWGIAPYSWTTSPSADRVHVNHHQPPDPAPTFASISDHKGVFEGGPVGGTPRKIRIRPSSRQTEELRKLYSINSHPSKEEREELGDRIGMRYQSVTNWFQNQRSLAKRRREEDISRRSTSLDAFERRSDPDQHTPAPLPPASSHPSLPISVPVPSADQKPLYHPDDSASISSFRRFGNSGPVHRTKRTRPEPYQLEALKKLFARTSNPSIEERGALALEIGMDIGKVTNWFRNLRQTARKRALKPSHDGNSVYDDSMEFDSVRGSRDVTPAAFSSSCSSSVNGDDMYEDHMDIENENEQALSDAGSDDDYQEAVTPPSVRSPSPLGSEYATGARNLSGRMDVNFLTSEPRLKKSTSSARIEDALLLLSFHRNVNNWH